MCVLKSLLRATVRAGWADGLRHLLDEAQDPGLPCGCQGGVSLVPPGRSLSQGGGLALEPGHDPAGAVMCPWCLLVTCVGFDTLLTLLTVCLCDRCVGALDLQLGNRAAQRRGVGNAWQVLLARWPG